MAGSSLLFFRGSRRVGVFISTLLALLFIPLVQAAEPQVATGYQHSIYLAADGTVWAWGDNSVGQLGQGNTSTYSGPVKVSGLSNIIGVSVGFYHSLALTSDGRVYGWGYDADAEMGQGVAGTAQTTPIQITGLANIKSIVAGGRFSLALRADGTCLSWGLNTSGECGVGTISSAISPAITSPTAISGVWRTLTGGGFHALGVGVNGFAYAWGSNSNGQIGNGSVGGSVASPTPVASGTLGNVVSIAAGRDHSVCSLADGSARIWGSDSNGQCANGATTGNVTTPFKPSINGITRVTAGFYTTYMWIIDGSVYAAGDNSSGQCLAATSTASFPSPQYIGYLYAAWNSCLGGLAFGQAAVGADGSVVAWGSNTSGQIGFNSGGTSVTTATTVNGGWSTDRLIAIAAGNAHSMGLKADGTVWTWGSDGNGRLGDDATLSDKNTPVQVVGIDHVVAIAAGSYHCLAIDATGRLWSWGWDSSYGQLGNDSALADQATPVLVGYYYRAIAGGAYHSLAVQYTGTVWAWGGDNSLQLGDDATYAYKPTPVQVAGLTNVIAVDAGYSHSCALRADGQAFYWGNNGNGQGGNNGTGTISTPTAILPGVPGVGLNYATVVQAGQYHSGGVDGLGKAYGWGKDDSGQVGSNKAGDAVVFSKSVPNSMDSLTPLVKTLSIGGDFADFTALLAADGTVYAVGSDSNGQLGDGAPQSTQSTPVLSDGSGKTFAIAAGDYHLLILAADGTVSATGAGYSGQLGNGSNGNATTPTATTASWLPTVSVSVIQDKGYETSSDPVIVRFSRTNSTSGALQVAYSWGGSSGLTSADFQGGVAPSGTITIPIGASYVDLALKPEDDAEDEGDDALSPERVDITLTANANLYVGGGSTVSGYFYDNDQANILVSASGPMLETAITYASVTVAGTTLTCSSGADLSLIRPGMFVYFGNGTNAGQSRFVASSDNSNHTITLQSGGLTDGSGNTLSVGGLAVISVSLQTKPTANVTLSAVSSNTAEGTLPASSVTLGPVAATATGSITFSANPSDGNQVVLNDGATIKTFEFDNNSAVTAGAVAVTIGGTVLGSRDNLNAAINAVNPTLVITSSVAGPTTLSLTADFAGSMNTTVTTTGSALSATGMSGGVTAWNAVASLAVLPVNDDVDDGDATYTITTNPATSTDPFYNGLNPTDLSQTTVDDDTAGFIITNSNIPLLESGRTYSGVVATGTTLTFPVGTDMTPIRNKMVLLIGAISRSITAVSGVTRTVTYNGAAVGDGTYAVRVGYLSYFSARLTSKPQSTVSVSLTSSNSAEGLPQASTITFDSTNWSTTRTFYVSPIDDDVDDGDKSFGIVTGAAVSSDTKYSGLNPADAAFLSVDDDTAGVVLSKTSADVSESGGNDTYTVVLSSQPTANVTVALTTSPAGQIATDVSSVQFTPSDWKNPKTVTITAINDDLIEAPHPNAKISHAVTSTDPGYSAKAVTDVDPIVVHDNDTPTITVTPTNGLVTSESGAIASFTVVLTSNPTANLDIDFASDSVGEAQVTTKLLTAQTVTAATQTLDFAGGTDLTGITPGMRVRVVGGNNNVYTTVLSVGATSVVLSASSLDGSVLADASGESVAFLPAQWSFASTGTAGNTISFAGGTDLSLVQIGMAVQFGQGGPHAGLRRAVTAVDNGAKTIDVDGAALVGGSDQVQIGGVTLGFTSGNYNQTQTIYLVGIDDAIGDGNQPVHIISSATRCSGFAPYDQQTVNDVSDSNLDDDQAGVRIVATGGSNDVAESGGSDTFTVRLNSQPLGGNSVTVVLSTTDNQTSVSPNVLFFSNAGYASAQTVTITAVNDDLDESDVHDGTITLQGYSSDANYNTTFPAVTVHVTDNDTAGIVVSPTSGLITTEAGGTATVSISLTSRPTVAVIVTFSDGSPTEARIDTDSGTAGYQNQLTISPATWNSPHLIQVIGQPDALDDGDQPFQISITSVSAAGDANYDNRVVPPLTGTNVDDDTRAVQLSLTGGSVTEASGGSHSTSYTVVLTAQPTSDVTVQVNPDAQVTVDQSSLTFTDVTWSTPQTIVVTAIDDSVAEAATHSGVVSHTVTGGGYDGIAIQDFTATITDNDTASIAADALGSSLALIGTPRETGHGSARNLTSVSVSGATRTVQFPAGTDLSAVFLGQTVRFLGATSPNNGVEAAVQSVDDSTDTLVVDAAVSDTSGDGIEFFAGIPVVLTSQPTANVEITFASNDTTEGFLRFPTLVFTPDTWNVSQVMTVIGADDAVADGAVPYQIQISKVRSSDPNYDALSVSPLAATTIDDDTAGYLYVQTNTPLLTTEAGGSDSFTVALRSQPTADVTIPISTSDTQQGSVSVSSLTFTPANWNAPRSVTVTGLDGDGVDNGVAGIGYQIVLGVPTISNGSDATYAAIDPTDLAVTNQSVNAAPKFDAINDVVLSEDAATQQITITGINDGQIGENQTLTLTAVSNNVALLANPTVSALAGTAPSQTATLDFQPVAQQSGTATVTVTLDDGQTTTQRTFSVSVISVNDAPTLTTISDRALNEDAPAQTVPLSGIGSGATNELQTLTITVVSDRTDIVPTPTLTYVAGATTGQLDFTPVPDASGTATITVTVQDDGGTLNGGVDTQVRTFQVVIAAVNDPPTITGLPNLVLNEDAGPQTVALSGIGTGAANEAQTLTVSAVSDNPALFSSLTTTYTSPAATGSLQFTPTANASGTATITVTVSDGGTGTSTATAQFQVQINAVNDPPQIDAIADVALAEDAPAQQVTVTGLNDGQAGENQTLTLTAVSSNHALLADPVVSALAGTAQNQTATLDFQPIAQQSGTAIVTVTLDDGFTTTQRTFTVTVSSVNDAPTLNAISDIALTEDAPAQTVPLAGIGTGAANEAQTLTITVASDRTDIVPTPTLTYVPGAATGQLDFTPVPNASGTATITVTVQDDGGTLNGGVDTLVRTFQVVIAAVNDPPTITGLPNLVLNEDAGLQTVALTGISTGAANEAQTLTVSAVSDNPALFSSLTTTYTSPAATGSLQFTPTANASGTATITVTVADGGTGVSTATAQFQVQINAVNDPPQIDAIADLTLVEDAGLNTVTLTGINDGQAGENQVLVLSATSSNHALLADPAVSALAGTAPNQTATLDLLPLANQSGSATITVTTDDGLTVVQRTFTLTVIPVNDAPTLAPLSDINLNEDAGLQHVTLTGIGTGAANEAQTLTITTTSDRPDIIPAPTVLYGAGATAGQLDFTPVANASGTATITVQIQDDGGTANSGVDAVVRTFQVVVAAVNDQPTLNPLTNLVLNEDAGLQKVVLDGISSGAANEPQTLTVTAVSDNPTLIPNPSVSYTSPSATGSLQFTPASDSAGLATITVTVADGGGGTATLVRTFQVLVNPVNDAPVPLVSTAASRPVQIGGARAITAADLSATDVDGGVAPPTPDPGLVFTVALPPGAGALQLNGTTLATGDTFSMQDVFDGLLAYVHGGGNGSTDGFAFTVTDLGITAGSVLASPMLPATDLAPASSVPQIFGFVIDRRPPLVQLLGAPAVFTEGQTTTTLVADAALVSDADSTSFVGGTIRVTVTGVAASAYQVVVHDQGTGTDQVSLQGATVRLNGLDVGTVSGGDGAPLVIACTSNMTPVAAQLVVRSLEFISPGGNPPAATAQVGVQITDDHGDQSTLATTNVTIVPVNNPPSAASPLVVTVANQPVAGSLTVVDPDSSTFTYTVTQAPAKGTLSTIAADGSFTYTPAIDQAGNDQFTVVVNDGTDDSAPCVVAVRISGSGTAVRPWLTSDPPLEVQEGDLLRFTVQVATGSLPTGYTVTFSLLGAPSGAAVVQSGPDTATVTWTATLTSGNHAAFRVRATEALSGTTADLPVLIFIHPLAGGGG